MLIQAKKSSRLLYIILLLIVFSVPLDGLSIEIGGTFRLSKVFCLFAVFIIFLDLLLLPRSSWQKKPYSFNLVFRILCAFFLATLLGNITFLFETSNSEAQNYFIQRFGSNNFAGLRTELKSLQNFVDNIAQFSCLLIPILVIQSYSQVITLAWTYVISSTFQAVLGIFQYIYYIIYKINLFPIYRGGLIGEGSFTQDAVTTVQGTQLIRVNALSGEPKYLALVLCFGLAIICFFLFQSSLRKKSKFLLFFLAIVHLITLILTLSTLGYLLLIIGIVVKLLSANTIRKKSILFISIFSLICYCLFYAFPFVANVLQARLFERIGFEDMDMVYLAFIQDSPSYLLLGTGFGNFHIASFKNAVEIIPWKFGIILPKIGIFTILATSGILGLAIFSSLPCKLILRFISWEKKGVNFTDLKNLIIYMIISGLCLRLTYTGLIWIGIGFAVTDNRFFSSYQSIKNNNFKAWTQY